MSASFEDLRDTALSELKTLMDTMQNDPNSNGKGKILAYWLNDYARFLQKEKNFDSRKLIRYKRGSIVKVHLGYNIGSEEGGLHYAIVMDNDNQLSSPTLTVIPLTSIKPGIDVTKLHRSKISLGDEVFQALASNLEKELNSARTQITELKEKKSAGNANRAIISEKIASLEATVGYCNKMHTEVSRMKTGSIALVGQITTVSKIRIFDPRYHNDALARVRVSDKTLDLLDKKIAELYMCPYKKTDSK